MVKYIQIHHSLWCSDKFGRLKQALGCGSPLAIGYLSCLWLIAYNSENGGKIERNKEGLVLEFAKHAELSRLKSERVLNEILSTGFLCEDAQCKCFFIPSWKEYSGYKEVMKEKDRARKYKTSSIQNEISTESLYKKEEEDINTNILHKNKSISLTTNTKNKDKEDGRKEEEVNYEGSCFLGFGCGSAVVNGLHNGKHQRQAIHS